MTNRAVIFCCFGSDGPLEIVRKTLERGGATIEPKGRREETQCPFFITDRSGYENYDYFNNNIY